MFPAIILAQGTSRRFGGRDKGLQLLAGRPLVAHVLDRLAGQAAPLAINGPEAYRRIATAHGAALIDETPHAGKGPLAGILAGLRWAGLAAPAATHMLVVPCDTPFLPDGLTAALAPAVAPGRAAIVAGTNLIGLWPREAVRALATLLEAGDDLRVRTALARIDAAQIAVPGDFADIDDPATLERANALLIGRGDGVQRSN